MTRGRVALAFLGILAAALVVGTALTAAVSLSGGFERAAERADLPDLIVRFDEESREEVAERFAALPNVETARFRTEIPRVRLGHAERAEHVHNAAIHVVEPGRRGYAIVAGRDVRGFGEVVVEQGVARELDLAVGDPLRIGERRREPRRIVGISVSPDNVAYPLAKVPRVYLAQEDIPPELTPLPVNLALAWLRDPSQQDVTLTQARAVSYGLRDLRFVTRAGVQVLIGQAAGIVIALLVAFSAVAVATAGIMLGASARSEVARRLPSIGVQRAVGFTRGRVALEQARRGALVAAPAAALGLAAGWLAMSGCSKRSTRSAPARPSPSGSPRPGSRSSPSSPPPPPGPPGPRPEPPPRSSSEEESWRPAAAAEPVRGSPLPTRCQAPPQNWGGVRPLSQWGWRRKGSDPFRW